VNAPADSVEPGLQADQRVLDRAWLRIGVGLLVVGQAMVFSLAVNLTPPEGAAYWILHGGLIASALGVLVFLGGDLVGGAWMALRQRRGSIDLLFLVTLAGAFGGSLVATFTRTGAVYYEVVAILVVVHTTGRMLGARSRLAALRAVDQTRERFETCDVRRPDGARVRRAVGALMADDVVVVAPGGPVGVDGEIVAGRGYVQETSMTGEWRPASRGPGDRVLAGTYSVDGSFEIRPAAGPRRLDGVLAAVADARLAPSELQRQADRLVAWFLPVVAAVSLATFGFWIGRGPWDRALFNAMAVLLVACPCAMGLATPVAVWGGLARLAAFGLVARTGDFLDALARCDVVCLDKTGTLSTETLAVRAWRTEPGFQAREPWLRAVVAAVEEGLTHPIAAALRPECHPLSDKRPRAREGSDPNACHLIDDKRPEVRERRIEPGLGVVAWVAEGAGPPLEVRVGEWELGGTGAGARATARAAGREVYVFVGGAPAATIELAESWREGLDAALADLAALGIEVEVLTGDPTAAPDGFPGAAVRAGLTPADKLARVRTLLASGRWVAFLGDGVNDAAAMSAAQASIAMGTGADLARAAAMAVYAGGDLRFLPRAIRLARRSRRSIRVNLRFAAGYNAVGMALAAAGWLHPVVAALLMVGSSAFVSFNALRGAAKHSGRD
jgi:heavy metal translocating P-type ATPase